MLGLPKTTEFNKRIPKQKFYENLTVMPGLKRAFTEQVKIIWWRNKIAAATVNLAPGEAVTEIEVLELRLNQPSLDESVLLQIDREIPYHILFLLEYEGKCQAWIGYKEASSGSSAFKVSRCPYEMAVWLYDALFRAKRSSEVTGRFPARSYHHYYQLQTAGHNVEQRNPARSSLQSV